MKKKLLFAVLILLLLIGTIIISRNCKAHRYRSEGEELISKIETYRKKNGILPMSVLDLDQNNKEMGEGPYYKRLNDSVYVVYFNIGFDNQFIYSSERREWIDKP